ncbi:hypothetical protein DV738_g4662, partial [Chaetothyriales sp. CBS 135597]
MTSPSSPPVPDEVSALELSERNDFSIFLSYPDINFDPEAPEMDGPGPAVDLPPFSPSSPVPMVSNDAERSLSLTTPTAEACSSPESDQYRNCYDTDLASRSASTPHTIPPSPLVSVQQPPRGSRNGPDDTYQAFMRKLGAADLPETAARYYRGLADQMLQIAAFLQPKPFYLSSTTTNQDILGCSGQLLVQLGAAAKIVSSQISAIHYITSLAPFTVTPTELAMPAIFNQRTSLISAHLTLPCRRSFRVLSALLTVFDAYVYSAYLHLSQCRQNLTPACARRINAIYDALQTLISSYRQWLGALHGLGSRYMTPLLRQIKESAKVQAEIAQRRAALLACDVMHARPLSEIIASQTGEEQS